jgi:hypothetical protein
MIAATATFAVLATEAVAQTPPPASPVVIDHVQLNRADIFGGGPLNVENVQDQVTVGASAQGNSLSVIGEEASVVVRSDQVMEGSARATTDLTLGGDTVGTVNATTQAGSNYLTVGAYDADMDVDATQSNTGGEVVANTTVGDDGARLLGGAAVGSSAISNTVALGGEGARVTGSIDQSSDATVRAGVLAETQYIPAEAAFETQAIANAIAVSSTAASSQDLSVRQRSSGDFVEADTSANAGNAWDLAGRARAAGNQAILYNSGGSVVAASDQANSAQVRASALATAYDYGRAEARARGAGNELSVGNNDVYVEIDSTQFNSGGVDATATFSGTNGYDAYVGAEAVGNAVTGYACSECEGRLIANSSQTNDGDVSATANTSVAGSGRAVITGANAVGNAASFYVSRSSH